MIFIYLFSVKVLSGRHVLHAIISSDSVQFALLFPSLSPPRAYSMSQKSTRATRRHKERGGDGSFPRLLTGHGTGFIEAVKEPTATSETK
ncbi:hypothetical protein E2C01_037222 [Portunus trituberculatus]|uniref:Uncharacterized protein n=1 Tax=Portunus trituberculatus TaxID=210409 RepID=A0A5B7FAT7_PORTR|nr:hypothetical protein [Portunus trituberculatus]